MDKRIAANALSYMLSKKVNYNIDGTDILALVEIIRELQREIDDGPVETSETAG